MLYRMLLVAPLVALVATVPVAHGAQCDGYVYLQGESCHANTRVNMDGLIDRTLWTDPTGQYGPFTLVLPGYHDFTYRHPGFYPESQRVWVPALGCRLPDITLESCARCDPASWQHYPYTIPGTSIDFPVDDGKHMPFADYPVEWWYANFHLTSLDTGKQYVLWVAFFKFPQMVLMSLTDLQTGQTYTADRYPLTFQAAQDRLDISASLPPFTDRWYNTECGANLFAFESWLDVNFLDAGVLDGNLHMRSIKKPMAVGGDGFVEIGTSTWSYYYSQTRMDVWGQVHLPGSLLDSEQVHGTGWMDHQWGAIPSKRVTWEWLSVQLNDNREIMVADVWEDGVEQGSFSGGLNYLDSNCNLEVWTNYDLTPLAFWTDPVTGLQFAVKWSVKVNEPSRNINLTVNRLFDNQIMRIGVFDILPLCFWEGSCSVTGTINGQAVSGTAFAEVTHPQRCSVGACWVAQEGCFVTTASECAASGGSFSGTCSDCAGWTSVKGEQASRHFRLRQNDPNPFNPSTAIQFDLPQACHVNLSVYSVQGRRVATLINDARPAGSHTITWDGQDETGQPVPAGIYFCRLEAGPLRETRKMTLAK